MSMLPQSQAAANQNWNAVLMLNSLEQEFAARHRETNAENVLDFMISDASNPASIHSCLRMARENAHTVRGTITTEMWETMNATWLKAREQSFTRQGLSGIGEFFEWVKIRSSLSRGVTLGTPLQDDAYNFIRLGTLLERADNTARILDVKYHVLQGEDSEEGGVADLYQWGALLRSVSAFEVYRKVYRDVITPERVTELLILRKDMPRSLLFCMNGVIKTLALLSNRNSSETERMAGRLQSLLHYMRIDDIHQQGLHEFLEDFLERINTVGNGVSQDFLIPLLDAA
jgi:uncharacterized alpha-E superfamily protein